MTNQFSKKVSDILLQSKEEARRTDYAAVMPEHLLLGLMQDETGPVNVLLRNENINRQAVQKELEERLSQEQSANNSKGDAFDRMAATDNEVMLTERQPTFCVWQCSKHVFSTPCRWNRNILCLPYCTTTLAMVPKRC